MTEQITVSAEDFKKMQDQIVILTKAADKNRLAKAIPREKRGTEAKVWVYIGEKVSEPTLIKSWSAMPSNSVRYQKDKGIMEDQTTEITLDIEENPEIKAKRMLVARTKDEEKLAGHQADLDKLLEDSVPSVIALDYIDFAVHKTRREAVQVKGTRTMDGKSYIIFDWEGQEKEIDITFIN